jgi:hypothetical protein
MPTSKVITNLYYKPIFAHFEKVMYLTFVTYNARTLDPEALEAV